jgi:hypothetical protein
MHKIGLLIIATGKYKIFLKDLIKTADKHFLNGHDVKYFLFIDEDINIESNRDIDKIYIEHREWPFPTLLRYKHFSNNEDRFHDLDYIYYIDSDMIFENPVGGEILGDVVCVAHPWFIGNRGTPENDSKSLAYIPDNVNFQYMAGAFFGGSKDCITNMFRFIAKQIDIDYNRGIIAKWHDESHSNKFFILYATKVLSSEYCYNKQSPFCINAHSLIPKIVQVFKNENEMRI